MARLGVTYQDIANAADQIVGQGKQPTIELIRNLLGTGSTTTIANHLRQWRAEQDGSKSVAIKESLPQEFVSMMKGLWQRLQAHADSQTENAKQEYEQTNALLRHELEKYKTNNQRWQKLYDVWIKEKDELVREKLSLDQVIVALQSENVASTAKLDAQNQQLTEKQQRIDELHRLHKLAQENLEHFRESTRVQRLIEQEKQAQQLQQVEIMLKNTEQQLVVTHQDKAMLQKHLDKVISENAVLVKSHDDIKDRLTQLQSGMTALEKEHNNTRRDVTHWQKQYEMLQKKFEEQSMLLVEQQKQCAVISQQISTAHDEVKELKEQNKLLAHEKWEIAQEKAQLEGVNKQMQKMIIA